MLWTSQSYFLFHTQLDSHSAQSCHVSRHNMVVHDDEAAKQTNSEHWAFFVGGVIRLMGGGGGVAGVSNFYVKYILKRAGDFNGWESIYLLVIGSRTGHRPSPR